MGTMPAVEPSDVGRLHDALLRLRDVLAGADVPLEVDDREAVVRHRDRLVADVGGHVRRLEDLEAPLLVVVGGVTGAGKSTLVNTLLGERVTDAGPLRPTTTRPTLVVHPQDAGRDDPRLDGVPLLRVVSARIPQGVALVDAPDVDSVATANKELADRLLDAADVWLWCTESRKYADRASMAELRRARDRRAALAVLIGQVRDEDAPVLLDHLRSLLVDEGLGGVPVLAVPWRPTTDGLLPAEAVQPVAAWLRAVADPERRVQTVLGTVVGAVGALDGEVAALDARLAAQVDVAEDLRRAVDAAFDEAAASVRAGIEAGVPVRGEVLLRWERVLGTGRVLRTVRASTTGAGRALRGLAARIPGFEELQAQPEVRAAATAGAAQLVVDGAAAAVGRVRAHWSSSREGRALLEALASAPSGDLGSRAEVELAEWQDAVAGLVAERGLERRSRGRVVTLGVNALATALIVATLVSTGGVLTGAEAGVAAGAGALNQVLLEAVLGRSTVAWLVTEARADLERRLVAVLAAEASLVAAPAAVGPAVQASRDALAGALAHVRAATGTGSDPFAGGGDGARTAGVATAGVPTRAPGPGGVAWRS